MTVTLYDEPDFVEKVKSLDQATLHHLVKEYTPILRRASLAMGMTSEVADELVQNTWTTFLDVAPRFEGRSKVKTFLFGILYNKVRENRRDQKKHGHEEWNEFESRFDDSGHWVKAPKNPEFMADQSQMMTFLKECLETLPENQRSVFTLREIDELSTEEIAEALGVTANNLGVIAFRAKANLRECLERK